ALARFAPEIVYLHLGSASAPLVDDPFSLDDDAAVERHVEARMDHLRAVWKGIWSVADCQIIVNTWEPPLLRPWGHLEASANGGGALLATRLNQALALAARSERRLLIHDAASLASTSGVAEWFAPDRWFSYKIATTPEAEMVFGHSL